MQTINKASKPYEVIYITSIMMKTEKDGDVLTCLALDEFSDFLYPPVSTPMNISDGEFIGVLVNFFNGIHEKYNPNIHAKQTTFIIDFPEHLISLIQGLVTKSNSVIHDPQRVEKIFTPVLKKFEEFTLRKE